MRQEFEKKLAFKYFDKRKPKFTYKVSQNFLFDLFSEILLNENNKCNK